jgi:hypothetical protein
LEESCYYGMFFNCINIKEINVSFTSWDVLRSTNNWVFYIDGGGIFYKPTELPAEFGGSRIPYNWEIINK